MTRATVVQHGLFGEDAHVPTITGMFAQVKYILEQYPEYRGDVGRTVAKVWYEFYGVGSMVEAGNADQVFNVIAGRDPRVPNYKTVSRNYHRVTERHPDLRGGGE